jgi:hypothetical protein
MRKCQACGTAWKVRNADVQVTKKGKYVCCPKCGTVERVK